jgi:hypothetical protein
MSEAPDSQNITKEEALAALNSPEGGSLRVLKAVGRQRDLYARQLAAGQKRLVVKSGFEEVCAEAAIKDFKEQLESEGEQAPPGISIFKSMA